MDDFKSKTTGRISSEKNFGLVFSVFFALLGCYQLYHSTNIGVVFLILSFVFLAIAIIAPSIFYWPNRLWAKIGILLGRVVSPIVMILVFAIAFVPMALIFKLIGKDPLNRKFEKSSQTYWITRNDDMQSMRRQF